MHPVSGVNRLVLRLLGPDLDPARRKARVRVLTAASFVLALALAGALSALFINLQILQKQRDAELIASHQGAILEQRVSRALSATYALAAVVRQGDGQIKDFHGLAAEMIRLYGGVSSLQLARDGIISEVEPLAGNEAAVGHNLLKDPSRNREAFLAIDTRRLTVAGPFRLLQGGSGIIGRLPVYLPNADGRDTFWGFTTALIRIPDLIGASGLPDLSTSGYRYELSQVHAGHPPTLIARAGGDFSSKPVRRTIEVPNGQWTLSIEPADGWVSEYVPAAAILSCLLAAYLVSLVTHIVLARPLELQRDVEERTRELADANASLQAEIGNREAAQGALQQLNRLYSLLSRTNVAIVRIRERDALLAEICRIAVEEGGFPLARITLAGEAGGTWSAGDGPDLMLDTCDQACREAPAATIAVNGATPLLVCDAGARGEQHLRPMCEAVQAAGFHSHVVLALRSGATPIGLFSLYAREAGAFDEARLRLLREMTEDVSFALDNIAREARRQAAEEKLRKLSHAVEQSANAVMITDRAGIIEYVNPWFTRITGYRDDEVIGRTPSLLKSGETHPETYKRLWDTVLSGREWTGELHNIKKGGELYWCLETISPLKNERGEITHFVAVTEDISERKQAEQTIRHLAFHDPLTGQPNRRLFRDRLMQAVAMRNREENAFALMLLDLDHFKKVNDSLGHDIGDALLKAVTARLQGCIRQGDTLARMGGDEFAILATGAHHVEDMARLAEKLMEAMRTPFVFGSHELYVTTSMGITLYPADGVDVDALIKNADIALYRAKDGGRNTFQFFTQDMNAAMMQRLRLENSMRRALERNEFILHYQPQADLLTGHIHGTEALIRWNSPDMGLVSPAEFIPVAEDTGLIVEIGEWVLRTACTQAKAWERAGVPMRVAVNLSVRQFQREDLADVIAGILQETGLPPAMLEVELTESILMKDTSSTAETLHRLHAMGVQISIDDFGTGYSSLSYLKRLPIQILKIDQSFVRDVPADPDDCAIVTAVIALAHSLKLQVVAEGVETAAQLGFLRDRRCDLIQGYLFSRPVTGDAVLELLQQHKRLEFDAVACEGSGI